MNVLPHLTLNVHRRSGAVSAIYGNTHANGYREKIFGDDDQMRKRVWKQRKNANLFLITKYFQHHLAHAPLSLQHLKYFGHLPLTVLSSFLTFSPHCLPDLSSACPVDDTVCKLCKLPKPKCLRLPLARTHSETPDGIVHWLCGCSYCLRVCLS